jgi:SPX domain protein involved in polyphosphate accumulation
VLSLSFQLKQKFLRKLFDGSLDTAAFFTKLRNNGKTETDVQSYAKLFAELRKLVDSKQVENGLHFA